MYRSNNAGQIEAKAASQAINKTVRMMARELGIQFPLVGTPSENRDAMIAILRHYLR